MPGRKHLEGKDLFGLMLSESSVHGCLALCFWACGEAEHHGGESTVEHHFMVARKQKQRGDGGGEGARDKTYHRPSDLLPPTRLHSSMG
jgi:hypothetical protein